MGVLELFVLLTIILTTGHIITLWSIYLERRFEKVRMLFYVSRINFLLSLCSVLRGSRHYVFIPVVRQYAVGLQVSIILGID